MTSLHNKTYRQIERRIWKGVSVYEPIGLRDKLSDDEIASLPNHPDWSEFPQHFRSWVFNTLDAIA